jgi:hypothetical protein
MIIADAFPVLVFMGMPSPYPLLQEQVIMLCIFSKRLFCCRSLVTAVLGRSTGLKRNPHAVIRVWSSIYAQRYTFLYI